MGVNKYHRIPLLKFQLCVVIVPKGISDSRVAKHGCGETCTYGSNMEIRILSYFHNITTSGATLNNTFMFTCGMINGSSDILSV